MSRGLAPAAIVSNMSTSQWAINFMPFSLFLEELVRAFAGQFRGILNLKFFKTYLITFCEMRWADPFCKLVICNPTRRRYWESVSSILLFGLGAAYVMQCIAIAMQYFFLIFLLLQDRSERSPLSISSKLSHPKEAPGEPQMSLQLKILLMKISSPIPSYSSSIFQCQVPWHFPGFLSLCASMAQVQM